MPSKYRFYIKPEEDACHRCLDETFSGTPFGSPFKIHEIEDGQEDLFFDTSTKELVFLDRAAEGRTGLFHKMCRCHAYVLEEIDSQTELVTYQAAKAPAARGIEREIRASYHVSPAQLSTNAGKDFFTIVSEALTNLFNKIFGLVKNSAGEQEEDNG